MSTGRAIRLYFVRLPEVACMDSSPSPPGEKGEVMNRYVSGEMICLAFDLYGDNVFNANIYLLKDSTGRYFIERIYNG